MTIWGGSAYRSLLRRDRPPPERRSDPKPRPDLTALTAPEDAEAKRLRDLETMRRRLLRAQEKEGSSDAG